ncbi:HAD-IIIC family phosphatase [uncultured Draconibacterium sp.]|uniref:HAD-IIIC family phosphatase n=1 Tax=uncultured Draconibacterium sp. TaxID=1573823 RepID=UPI0025F70436|nr:HAD-IIIC family phosphatase [uncultured Draconibacterium sp.]
MSRANKIAKCVVWDLDNTLWHGTLPEGDEVRLKEGIKHVLETLDSRGILQSVASKNNYDEAMHQLQKMDVDHFFLLPQISWNPKSEALQNIATGLNIGVDSLVFVDDQEFERQEVQFRLPEVRCVNGNEINDLLNLDYLNPEFVTSDSALRREMYKSDFLRKEKEQLFQGTNTDFLETLGMKLDLFRAGESDLQRAVELTERTNQLNSSGVTFSYEELKELAKSENHLLLMARLEDKFGTYGHIGLILIEKDLKVWTIQLFLMSCRVMSRGIGAVLLGYLINLAREKEVELKAVFKPTSKNRMMNITYRFAGFTEETKIDGIELLRHRLCSQVSMPAYLKLNVKL